MHFAPVLAVKKRSAPVVTKLIDAQCNPEIYDGDGATPLDIAIKNADRACILALTKVCMSFVLPQVPHY